MRLLISLILTLITYSLIVFVFVEWVVLRKPPKQKRVFIHTAIVVNKQKGVKRVNKAKTYNKPVIKKAVKKVSKPQKVTKPALKPKPAVKKEVVNSKKVAKKIGSKTNVERGGSSSFSEIFQNVEANVPTTPVKLEKLEMSRFKGETLKKVESAVNKVNLVKVEISYKDNSAKPLGADKIDLILGKLQQFWYSFSEVPNEYAVVNIINQNGKIFVRILDTNLDLASQQKLIEELKSLDLGNKDFNLIVRLQTKVRQ